MNSPSPAPRRGLSTGVLTALAIAFAAAAGWFVQKHLAAPDAVVEATAPAGVSTAGDATADAASDGAAPEGEAAAALPATLPRFTLTDRAGKPRTLGDWKGQPLVVNYWATWCPPCVREIPLLSQIRREHAAQKLEVIGIAVDFREDVLKFADEKGLDYPLLIGEEDGLAAVSAVGMQPAFPFTLFADSRQRIVTMKVGELHRDDLDLILGVLFDVDSGKLEPADARQRIDEGLKDLATKRALAGTGEAG